MTGCAIRIAQYLAGRSLWVDEAMLAVSIGTRSFAGLTTPLDYDQAAPIPFLWMTKAATSLGGMNELCLRIVSLLAGIAVLFALWRLAVRICSPPGVVATIVIAALCPGLVYYSNELKPYCLDALVTVFLVTAALDVMESGAAWATVRRFLLMGAVSIWFSITAVLVLVGAGAGLLISLRRRIPVRPAVYMVGAWGISFGLAYEAVYHRATASAYMAYFWSGSFLGINSFEALSRSKVLVVRCLWGVFVGPPPAQLGVPQEVADLVACALILAAGVGVRSLVRRSGIGVVAIMIGPLAALVMASIAGRYPLAARLVIFAQPLLVLLVGAGVAEAASAISARRALLGSFGLSLCIGLLGVRSDGRWALSRVQWADTKGLFEVLDRDKSGDPVYVYFRGVPIWSFYSADWRSPDSAHLQQLTKLAQPGGPAFEMSGFDAGRSEQLGGLHLRGRWEELIGLPNGIRYQYWMTFSSFEAQRGWAESEVTRMRSIAHPGIQLVFLHFIDRTHTELQRELGLQGAVCTPRFEGQEALLIHCDFSQ